MEPDKLSITAGYLMSLRSSRRETICREAVAAALLGEKVCIVSSTAEAAKKIAARCAELGGEKLEITSRALDDRKDFYAVYNKCEHCGRSERLHIGKRSGGWEFMFRAHEEKSLECAVAWRVWMDVIGAEIIDEYDDYHEREDFWRQVEETRGKKNQVDYILNEYPHGHLLVPGEDYKDPDGWAFHRGDFS